MAQTTITTCDRCGREILPVGAGIGGGITTTHVIYGVELCPTCIEKLKEWLKPRT